MTRTRTKLGQRQLRRGSKDQVEVKRQGWGDQCRGNKDEPESRGDQVRAKSRCQSVQGHGDKIETKSLGWGLSSKLLVEMNLQSKFHRHLTNASPNESR